MMDAAVHRIVTCKHSCFRLDFLVPMRACAHVFTRFTRETEWRARTQEMKELDRTVSMPQGTRTFVSHVIWTHSGNAKPSLATKARPANRNQTVQEQQKSTLMRT